MEVLLGFKSIRDDHDRARGKLFLQQRHQERLRGGGDARAAGHATNFQLRAEGLGGGGGGDGGEEIGFRRGRTGIRQARRT